MTIVCNTSEAGTVIVLEGELNAMSSQALKATLAEAATAGKAAFVVDLTGVTFIDSSGLGALVSGLKQAKLAGGNLVLAGLQEQARLIFEITMAYRIFDIFETTAEALDALSR